ncbi:hypothetical protein LTR17_017030 [Elasticomyces elasticus]|nr:hypothetical protein LTR17_017030 [Elasticomyces elasticus]
MSKTCTSGQSGSTFDRQMGLLGASWFCGQFGIPAAAPSPAALLAGGQPTVKALYGYQDQPSMVPTVDIIMRIHLAGGAGCPTPSPTARYSPEGAEDCMVRFTQAMDECDTDTTAAKRGAGMMYYEDESCVVYDLMPCPTGPNQCNLTWGDWTWTIPGA